MRYPALLLIVSSTIISPAISFASDAENLVAKSIAYHDPNDAWSTGKVTIEVDTEYSAAFMEKRGAKPSSLTVVMAPGQGFFSRTKRTATDTVFVSVDKGVEMTVVNGDSAVTDADRERLRIAAPSGYRDYDQYLYGMPMKLRDPGTIIDPNVSEATFEGNTVQQVRVTYEVEVGGDTWYFYFSPETSALVGYRFYHDEAANDGEYIAFSGEIEDPASGLKLPRSRAWYYNNGSGHLATDVIVELRVEG